MTPEQEARTEQAQRMLERAMMTLPFLLSTADHTRVDVWKKLRHEAEKMLRRNVREPSRYEEMTMKMNACGDAPLPVIARWVYDDKAAES